MGHFDRRIVPSLDRICTESDDAQSDHSSSDSTERRTEVCHSFVFTLSSLQRTPMSCVLRARLGIVKILHQ